MLTINQLYMKKMNQKNYVLFWEITDKIHWFVLELIQILQMQETSDNTMNDLIKFSRKQGYDGCIMINPYPLICNKPNDLPIQFNKTVCELNMSYISAVFERCNGGDLLLSWGDYIAKNNDFKEQANQIINLAKEHNMRLIHINSLTKIGNPRHFRNLCRNKDFNAGIYVINEYTV